MPAQQAENSLKAILGDTARAHHDAFAATDGDDPDWPLWYAANLKPLLREFLAAEMTQSRLVHCLVALDDEHAAEMSDEPWPSFYAIRLIERYGTAAAPATDVLLFRALPVLSPCPRRNRRARSGRRATRHPATRRPEGGARQGHGALDRTSASHHICRGRLQMDA
jgi:hypothetical protein